MALYPINDTLSRQFQHWLQEELHQTQASEKNEKENSQDKGVQRQEFCSDPELFRWIFKVGKKLARKNQLDKDDIIQEAFFLLLQNPDLLIKKDLADEKQRARIITCLKYNLIDHLKKGELKYQKHHRSTDLTEAMNQGTLPTMPNGTEETTSEERLLRQEQLQLYQDLKPWVLECLKELPPEDQNVLKLLFYDKYSVKELAAKINTSYSNAYKRKDKALTKLRKALKQKLMVTNSSLKDELIPVY